jgi:hypothetical protein
LLLQEHDAAELARLAQVLADGRQQQQCVTAAQASPQAGPGTDWVGQHQLLLQQLCSMGTAAQQLLPSSSPPHSAAAAPVPDCTWAALASVAAALRDQQAAAAAALPLLEQAAQAQQHCLAEAVAAALVGPGFNTQACAQAERQASAAMEAQVQLEACRALARKA